MNKQQSLHHFKVGKWLACLTSWLILGFSFVLNAAVVNATYNAPDHVPITTGSYIATGNTIQFTMNFQPTTGTSLTVIRNTGLNFIQGKFDNLAHGQTVILNHNGQKFYFIANYFGGAGRDLVLQWANIKPMAWGNGGDGKLGNNETADHASAVPVNTADVLWGKFPISGSAGGNHSLGISSDGTVVSWGLNTNGQLGNNSTVTSKVPVSVSIPNVPTTRTVASVSAGTSHSLALCSDGVVVSWGLNMNGQLGDSSTNQRTAPVNVNTAGVLSGKSVSAISAGGSHSLALCTNGTVVSWGLNANGQLGNGNNTQSTSPVAVTTSSGALVGKTVVAIAAGGSHSLALCSNGTVVSWGLNANGQLGNSSTAASNIPVAVNISGVPASRTVVGISAGASHSLAVCSDGTVMSWGLNDSGQLGNGNNSQSNVPVAVSTAAVLNGKSVFMVSAGANHSIAHCTDGAVVAWGMGTSGQLGNNNMSSSNVPVTVNTSGLSSGWFGAGQSGFSGVISGPTANHALAIVASPEIDVSHCGFHKQITYNQFGTATPALDPDSPFTFSSYAGQGSMGAVLASSTLTPPSGGTGIAIYENGSTGLQLRQTYRTQSELDAAYPIGSYLMTLRTSTPNTYPVALSLGSVNYPVIPKVTNVTNANWINGIMKITNPANPVVITWVNPANCETWFQIDNTDIQKPNSTPATSFTIDGNSLQNNTLYRASVQVWNHSSSTSIAGLPNAYGNSSYKTQVQFMIQVGTPTASDPSMYLLIKNHNQVQSSNSDPVDSPNRLPDADCGPYSVTAESPVVGNLSGPSGTSFPLAYHADSDGVTYEYLSATADSPTALNATHPNGNYTFPGGTAVNMPSDSYPATAKVLTVNGATPVWNNEGLLALDPTVDNTIAWSVVTVPNFATQGHQSVEFENYQDFNFDPESLGLEIERGVMTNFTTPVTSITIPKFSMTGTYTYMGYIGYASVPTYAMVSTGIYKIGAYETANQFMTVALKPQTINFGTIPDKLYPSAAFTLGASASSGLPVTYEVVEGPAIVSGNIVTLVGVGTVIIRASQSGTGVYASAVSVTQSFAVTYGTKLDEFRGVNGLAADGSQDLQTPANDGIANLLKYAFNMIGAGTGQASSLTKPNVQIVGVSGNAGLPRQGTSAGKLTITYVRRKATSTPGVTYAVEFSSEMSSPSWSVVGSETKVDIDTNFERVTVTDNAIYSKRFARVRVIAN